MATQRLKGLWILAEILLNGELTDKEKEFDLEWKYKSKRIYLLL